MTTIAPVTDSPKEPFHPSVDPDIFFETPEVAVILGHLIAVLEGGAPPLAVLTGPPGIGKTTVLRRLSREFAGAGWKTMIEGLPLGLDAFRDRLAGAEPGRRILVGLDEAQALSRDLLVALDPLLTLRPDLAILLVGHTSLEAKLDGLRLGGAATREGVRVRLAPLDAGAARAYVDYRWRTVRPGAHPFVPEALDRIAAASDGNPQMINLMCSLALRLADLRGLDHVTAQLVDEATAELPGPEPRHRVSYSARSGAAPSSRLMRSAIAAAVVIPPLLVGSVLLLRPAAHGPERRDQPPPAASAPRPTAEPVRVAALVPEPAAIDFTSDAEPEHRRRPMPAVAPVSPPPPDVPAPRAADPPVTPRRSGEGEGRREATPAKVLAAPPMLPPMPPRALSVPSVVPVVMRERGKDEALLRRAEYGDLNAVQTLLVEGASPEARDHAGFTPLMLAVIHGHPAIVQALIAGGARVNVQNRAGLTPAMLAAINNRAAVLRTLLDRGADMNARTRAGWTALTYAAWRGHAEIVRLLLARGANPNVTDREGWTILQYASWRANDPIVSDDLPGAPADIATRSTASGAGHAEVVALLRQAGGRR